MSGFTNPKFCVLIVEDDEDARSNMVDILSLDGYEIETASHCSLATNALENKNYGAIIVDWRLPDGDGARLFPIIVENQPDTPVIIVTGMRDFDVAVTAIREGAYDFLLKPINPDALRAVLMRVRERSEHLKKIEEARARLVQNERLAAIGQMVAGLAHESRNSLQRSHACLANLAIDVRDMPESLTLVRKTQAALDNLNSLLDEVRNYAAPIVLEKSPTNLESLVRETWTQITESHPEAGQIQFKCEKSNGFPAVMKLDRRRFGQVFWNLLENARFACESSPAHKTIEVTFEIDPESGKPTVEISDSGMGIASDDPAGVFEPFFTTKTKGTGLGLAICRRLVQAHHGEITVSNAPDAGAVFTIALPAVDA